MIRTMDSGRLPTEELPLFCQKNFQKTEPFFGKYDLLG